MSAVTVLVELVFFIGLAVIGLIVLTVLYVIGRIWWGAMFGQDWYAAGKAIIGATVVCSVLTTFLFGSGIMGIGMLVISPLLLSMCRSSWKAVQQRWR